MPLTRDEDIAELLTSARNIAVFGNVAGTGAPRVPGWTTAAGDIDISVTGQVIRVSASNAYVSSPLFYWLETPPYGEEGIGPITITAYHEQRYIGW